MAVRMGLKASEIRKIKRLLNKNHCIDVTIQVIDMEHKRLGDVSRMMLSGQINYDTSAAVTRTAEFSFVNPTRRFGIDTNNPDKGTMSMDRMLKVTS